MRAHCVTFLIDPIDLPKCPSFHSSGPSLPTCNTERCALQTLFSVINRYLILPLKRFPSYCKNGQSGKKRAAVSTKNGRRLLRQTCCILIAVKTAQNACVVSLCSMASCPQPDVRFPECSFYQIALHALSALDFHLGKMTR